MLKKLRDIWNIPSDSVAVWQLVVKELDAELDDINSIGDALEQITVADLLEVYPQGFAVGPMAGLNTIVRPAGHSDITSQGILIVERLPKD